MEHYKKVSSVFLEDPCRTNEMKVAASGKANDLCTKASHLLKGHPSEGIIISAAGIHVTKAVAVVELLKKRLPGLKQTTTIKYSRIEDTWEPNMEGLESMRVTRKIPSLLVHLSVESTDEHVKSADNNVEIDVKSSSARRTKSSRDQDRPKSSGDQDRPKSSGDQDRSKSSGDQDRSKLSGDQDRPKSSGDQDRPKSSSDQDRPKLSGDQDRSKLSGDQDRPKLSGDQDRSKLSGDQDRPKSSHQDRPKSSHQDRSKSSGDQDRPKLNHQDRPVQHSTMTDCENIS